MRGAGRCLSALSTDIPPLDVGRGTSAASAHCLSNDWANGSKNLKTSFRRGVFPELGRQNSWTDADCVQGAVFCESRQLSRIGRSCIWIHRPTALGNIATLFFVGVRNSFVRSYPGLERRLFLFQIFFLPSNNGGRRNIIRFIRYPGQIPSASGAERSNCRFTEPISLIS